MKGSTTRRVRLKISEFKGTDTTTEKKLLSPEYSPDTYNFTFTGGALKAEIGVDVAMLGILTDKNFWHYLPELPEGESVANLHFYRKYDFTNKKRDDKIVVKGSSGNYYVAPFWETGTFEKIPNIFVSSLDSSVNYRYNGNDVLIIAGTGGGVYIYDGTKITYVKNAPTITSMCVHYERIYATVSGEANSLWFSDDFNPVNWNASLTEGGFINFDDDGGRVIKAVSFLDHVYVFRDYGIVRLTAYGSQENYTVSKVYVSASRILPDTIACCGDRIIFLTDEGLFSFNGYTMTMIAKEITNLFHRDRSAAKGAYVKGNYYLCCRLRQDAGKVLCEEQPGFINNSVVRVDVRTGKVDIFRGVDVKGMTAMESLHIGEVLLFFRGQYSTQMGMMSKSGKLFNILAPKHWECAETDLGRPDTEKTVRTVWLTTATDCTLTVVLDGKKFAYEVKGGSEPKKIVVNRRGSTVGFMIDTDKKSPVISGLTAEVDVK